MSFLWLIILFKNEFPFKVILINTLSMNSYGEAEMLIFEGSSHALIDSAISVVQKVLTLSLP